MIDLQDISKVYQVGEERVRALNHVTMHIYPKEFVSIIGPSGSGKSTLMNIIGCLDTKVRNQKIGFIFQIFNLISKLSAEENVELPLIYRGVRASERTRRVREALERVGLAKRAKHLPTELSGGQQQRVAIARALVTEPSLLLADEPTGNLDSRTSKEIMDILHELHEQGNTVVLITHDNDIARQAPRSLHILDGKVTEVRL